MILGEDWMMSNIQCKEDGLNALEALKDLEKITLSDFYQLKKDIDEYNIREKEYDDAIKKRTLEGRNLFMKYYDSLWD
jgi:hypothetical protein